jgi:hypothetical protein
MFLARDLSWWYWAATDLLLLAGLAGAEAAFPAAIALGAVQTVHFRVREGRASAFPVQVRIAYLGLLLLALWPPLRFIYWIQLAGTTAMVLFDYCPLARLLSLMPWNRSERLSLGLIRRTVASPPVRGNVLQGLPAER